jgi:hypothetical protein
MRIILRRGPSNLMLGALTLFEVEGLRAVSDRH